MKLPLVLLAVATIVLQSGCVTGRRSFSLEIPTGRMPAPTKGKVYVASVTDNREFQNKPSDPSTPSIDGDVANLSPAQKERMIGRQRGGFGKAMGDIALPDGDSVPHRVQLLVEEGLRRAGYAVTSEPEGAMAVTVFIDKFWAWMSPGMWALTFEAKIACVVSIKTPTGSSKFVVWGFGKNHGQVAKDGNWQEAYQPAFEDFLANFKREMAQMDPRPSR